MNKLLYTFLLVFSISAYSSDCKVKLTELSEKYEGECKKGYAHGKGKAWGKTDFYEGEFKKGLPHGYGIYKWANGNTYHGNFSKGHMDGEGKLTSTRPSGEKEIKKGFFKKGKYLGTYKIPYKVISQQGIRTINFQENSLNQNEVRVTIYSNGIKITPSLQIIDTNNTRTENRNGTILTNVIFPLKRVDVSFNVDSFSYKAVFDIYKEGNWEVIISL